MSFDPTRIAAYTADDARLWSWTDEDEGTHVGYIADHEEGVSMGMAFVRFRRGVRFEFTWPYDEVSVVTKGSLTIHTGGRRITAREGEILNQPRGVPGTFEIEEDLEMICVHYPTFAKAQGLTLAEYKADTDTDTDHESSAPVVAPRGPEAGGGFFDPTTMQVFSISDVPQWITLDANHGAYVGYLADKAEGSPMGMAYSDFRRGGVFEFDFPYDEVAAVTQGAFTVRSEGRVFRVRAGEMLYMPKGVSAVFEIEEDTVAVGLHYPTYEDGFGTPPHQA
ncbi:DUF861 domain-containing protein [Spiractinospora alimapuensis]|uniref:cupin domain-containing protein n=1 Tax=Spiractinospora alimapuensis TaxID=2820884 RepID=UPI001F1FE734|nr:cupin domain-containing protein [Spiractinospora alimapuensis]QVQ51275.1 DUF861 domain-containing protein [Spiractinospora alimapuensis]